MDLLFKNYTYFFDTYFRMNPFVFFLIYIIMLLVLLTSEKIYGIRIVFIPIIALYITLLLDATLLCSNRIINSTSPLPPFYGLFQVLQNKNPHFIRGMLSNTVLFIPAGLIMLGIYKFGRIRSIAFVLIISISIEILQVCLSVGVFEIEDIVCNTIGGFIGVVIIEWISIIASKRRKKDE